jgi:aflatoxin B1 aldehyde reductase
MKLEAKKPTVILGTMNFGDQVDEATADRMVRRFLEKGYTEIDTAYKYCGGVTEEILGRLIPRSRREKVCLATKVTPTEKGGLRPEEITRQLETSLGRLKTDYVDLLYLHAPDPKTPIEVTLECCERLFRKGRFREFGLSNYAAWQVVDIWHICRRNGWTFPAVYQGMYNAITRDVERELFPAARTLGIRFYAFNPLAGGFLAGKYKDPRATPSEGRFVAHPTYIPRYWKESYFNAAETVRRTSAPLDIGMADGALRWMRHHSLLKGANRDGMIIGATSLPQFEANLESCERGDLPGELNEAFNRAWETARPDCYPYFRT